VSKHTSLVAVDKTPVRPAGDPLLREQVPNLIPHGQSGAAIFGFPATATNAASLRFTGTVAVLLALFLLLISSMQRGWRVGLAH
jgi:Ca-activated chloride channel family protein